MKNLKTILLAATLLNGSVGYAQVKGKINLKSRDIKIASGSSLAWYAEDLRRKANTQSSQSGGAETIISVRSSNGIRAEVGTNLRQASSIYTNNGATRNRSVGDMTCIMQPKKINDLNTGDFSIFSLSNVSIFPGDFVDPIPMLNNSGGLTSYTPNQPRNHYKIGMSIFNNQAGNRQITVTDFNTKPQAKVQDSLLRGNYGAGIPTKGILEVNEIKSTIALASSLNVSTGLFLPLEELGIPADITAGLKLEGKDSTNLDLHYYLVSFIQPLYSLNLLTLQNGLFATQSQAASNQAGAYVSDVTYGRRAVFIFASTSKNELLDAMFKVSAEISTTGEGAEASVGSDTEGRLSRTVKSSTKKFWGILLGGNGNGPLGAFSNVEAFNVEFKKYIVDPTATIFGPRTNAVPLTYTLNSISTGQVIGIRSIGDFEEPVDCSINSYNVDINFEGFTINKVDEFGFDDQDDIFGTVTLKNYKTGSQNATRVEKTLFTKGDNYAISKKVNETYEAAEDPYNISGNLRKEALLQTTLNFTQTIKDWEPGWKPEYKPLSERDLQYSFDEAKAAIESLSPGQKTTINKRIKLFEKGESGKAALTLNLKITVTRI